MSVLDIAKGVVSYDPDTGRFTRLTGGGRKRAGDPAGYINSTGYVMVFLAGKFRLGHRLAWLMTYGEWPRDEIDHINGDRSDNRICNLRACSRSENMRNVRGKKGWHWHSASNKWQALIRVNGKRQYLGRYSTEMEAAAAYRRAAIRLHGEFVPNVEPAPKPKQESMFGDAA